MNEELRSVLQKIYEDHSLSESNLDYSLVDSFRSDFDRLAQLTDCCYFIVDLHRFEYIYTSDNFYSILGYKPFASSGGLANEKCLDSKIHPDDYVAYKENLRRVGDYILNLAPCDRVNFRHVFVMRIENAQKEYVWVSWERQSLQTDRLGNLWLMLGCVSVLSEQSNRSVTQSFFLNRATGDRIAFNSDSSLPIRFTPRELEVLHYLQVGLLSKEIADSLSVSVHTVNVHRQNIFLKMGVRNSLEAVEKGRRLGLLK